ncbi:MAG: hypothetical protein KGJ02_01055 [Verrucomicrobiota bacterium]|nr:hypothetical protein [Verrucomicrobiota bacterium]
MSTDLTINRAPLFPEQTILENRAKEKDFKGHLKKLETCWSTYNQAIEELRSYGQQNSPFTARAEEALKAIEHCRTELNKSDEKIKGLTETLNRVSNDRKFTILLAEYQWQRKNDPTNKEAIRQAYKNVQAHIEADGWYNTAFLPRWLD